jgi:hypothetical protein
LNPSPASGKEVGGVALAQFRARSVTRRRIELRTAARPAINDMIMKKEIEES